ncbi:MAG: prolyl-tRNA synthetase associated domain-containing protein [Pseudomonadota bacterium]
MVDASSSFQDSLPVSSDALLDQMRVAGIEFELFEHKSLRTVEDSKTVQGVDVPKAPGRANIKNFYLRDKKKRNYLVVLEQDRVVDLADLGAKIGAGKVSFGSPDRLMEYLGVRPGAVSPLAMMNGSQKGVCLYVDKILRVAEWIHAHPLVNDRTVAIRPADLEKLLAGWGVELNWFDPAD